MNRPSLALLAAPLLAVLARVPMPAERKHERATRTRRGASFIRTRVLRLNARKGVWPGDGARSKVRPAKQRIRTR